VERRPVALVTPSRSVARTLRPYFWLLPSLTLVAGLIYYPIYRLFVLGLSNIDMAGQVVGFAGLGNLWYTLSDPVFPLALRNTVIWTVSIVGVTTLLSVPLAVLYHQDFPGRRLFRAILVLPWAASLMISGLIWRWIFDPNYGAFNLLLEDLHLISRGIAWLGTPESAFMAVIWVGVFVSIPFTTFVYLAGLQAIPASLYEAASLDGASRWQSFWRITVPNLGQSFSVSTVLNVIYVFNSFPIIWVMTRGGPANSTQILVTYLYEAGFQFGQLGEASVIAILSFFILLIFGVLFIRLVRTEVTG
jgi:multiple sugar transport system permease protein